MKLIIFNTLLISFALTICGQKFQQEPFSFSPQFQSTSSSYSSDKSMYFPLESQTPTPYFNMNNIHKIPFQFFPPTGTKTPSIYSTPLPIYLESTLRIEDDENENDRNGMSTVTIPKQSPQSQMSRQYNNTVVVASENKKEGKFNERKSNHQFPLQKVDAKLLVHESVKPKELTQGKDQNLASRRMIVTSEIQRSDQGPEHIKASNSFNNPQYVQAPGIFISSTTEPAIPILRLSNEMDLDGSFSYEALGADQTHYVQHSRMENMGNDKEEQVVEGSYSYIGDDGRTYTVHYIADSNGFRATGDHLPVPPPVPEIIQRAVQYNLAEEAKKPPNLRSSWENDEKDYEINERNIFNSPPTRNLFTGKTPEAFSFGFSQGSNTQNNLVPAASFQVPTKSNYEVSMDQAKSKINPIPIAPQITFLASQGARNPSTQTQPPTKLVNAEKSALPQLMNYEAEMKDSDQDANKALWRWQYGLSSSTNQNPKNSISRSFSEGDDVVINFSDMTPEQYTHMIQSQILSENTEASNNLKLNVNSNETYNTSKDLDNKNFNISEPIYMSTENSNYNTAKTETTKSEIPNFHRVFHKQEDKLSAENPSIRADSISYHNFIPQTQIATQSYTFGDSSFLPLPNGNSDINLKVVHISANDVLLMNDTKSVTTLEPIFSTSNYLNKINHEVNDENSSFRPIVYQTENEMKQYTTTTEASMNEKVRENIFLRNLFKPPQDQEQHRYKNSNENQNQENKAIKQDKEFSYHQYKENPQNEIKPLKSKPLDVNNFLNYLVMKNHFESVKTKQKNKPVQQNFNVRDIPIKENINYNAEPNNNEKQKQEYDYKTLNHQQQQELQGLIKNYKVLQRQKNTLQRGLQWNEPQRNIKTFQSPESTPIGSCWPFNEKLSSANIFIGRPTYLSCD